MTTPEPTIHKQYVFELDGGNVSVDEGLYLLLSYVWLRGMITRSSCQGGGPTPKTELPYIIFPDVDDAVEFLRHTAVVTDFRFGELVGLNVIHPLTDIGGAPEGKVTWMPRLTIPITNAWGTA